MTHDQHIKEEEDESTGVAQSEHFSYFSGTNESVVPPLPPRGQTYLRYLEPVPAITKRLKPNDF